MKSLAIMVGILFFYCSSSCAEIYSWEDEGGVHFTDNPQNVPAKKKGKNVSVRPGGGDSREWQYFNTQYSTNYYYAPSTLTYQGRDRYRVLIKEEYQRENHEKLVEIDCNRRKYRYGGSSENNSSLREDEEFFRYDDYAELDNTMKALARLVCDK